MYCKKKHEKNISAADFEKLKIRFENDARNYFNTPMDSLKLDAILSINNYNSGHAAMAKYPCLTIPMGYK